MAKFRVKRFFNHENDLMPELHCNFPKGSKSSLDDILGEKLVFELVNVRRNRRKRKAKEDSVISNSESLNIEAHVDMVGGKPHLKC
jgi:hypothetical protein